MHLIVVPDLGMPEVETRVSAWLVALHGQVDQGERVVEISAGDAIVDLPSPVRGVLVRQHFVDDDVVRPGDTLGEILADS